MITILNLLLQPFGITSNQDPYKAECTFIPRNKAHKKKTLDWLLLPSVFSRLRLKTRILPHTTTAISDHLLTNVTLSLKSKADDSDLSPKQYISNNLFKSVGIRNAITNCSIRVANDFQNNPLEAVEVFRFHVNQYLYDLTQHQAEKNKQFIKEIKSLCDADITPEISARLNEILLERITSSRNRFIKYISESRHSPSKAMTIMSKEASNSGRPSPGDSDKHLNFWINHFSQPTIPPDEKYDDILEYFFKSIKDDQLLPKEDSTHLEGVITVDEVQKVVSNAPNNSSPLKILYKFIFENVKRARTF